MIASLTYSVGIFRRELKDKVVALTLLLTVLSAVLSALIRRWLNKEGLTEKQKRKLNQIIFQAGKLEEQAVKMGCTPGGVEWRSRVM